MLDAGQTGWPALSETAVRSHVFNLLGGETTLHFGSTSVPPEVSPVHVPHACSRLPGLKTSGPAQLY
jgi:hypothetical protein